MRDIPKWVRGVGWGALALFLGVMALGTLGSVGTLLPTGGGYYAEEASMGGSYAMPALGTRDAALSYDGEHAPTMPEPVPGGDATAADHGLKIVKTGTVTLRAADPAKAIGDLKALVDSYRGFIDDEGINQGEAPYGYVVFRVPSALYEQFVEEVKASGDVESVSISKDDMTRTYNDTAALLESNEEELAAVQALLERAGTVEEILAIRGQTERLRAENRQLRASIEGIDDQASYSTLTVEVRSPAAIRGEDYWGRNTVQGVLDAFQSSLRAVVLFLAALLPWAVAAAAVLGLIRGIARLARRRRGAAAAEEPAPSDG